MIEQHAMQAMWLKMAHKDAAVPRKSSAAAR
jgi:hypothetical protein